MSKSVKDLKYWRERSGQIAWRLAEQKAVVNRMERDLRECRENIKRLSAPAPPAPDKEGA